jgi:spermidine synthase
VLYLFFFCSGVSGLIYQVIWVREFGNVFGNTIYSASIVVATFMLGLGLGSYVGGIWSDRRYTRAPESLLRVYAYAELVIAALGLAISFGLPRLGAVSALASSYVVDRAGWFVLSPTSYVVRSIIAVAVLTPITVLMGGTLTLLVRYLVRRDVEAFGGWRIALLYAVNTAGAAAGAFLTDFVLVPHLGLFLTQSVAAAFNSIAGCGALYLSARAAKVARTADAKFVASSVGRAGDPLSGVTGDQTKIGVNARTLVATASTLGLSGFAAMGMEIVWFRHFTLLLGGFRAVLSLLLTVILAGIGVGALAGGVVQRRWGRPAEWLMIAQALFVVFVLAGLGNASFESVRVASHTTDTALRPTFVGILPAELWFNLRPMLGEVALPALLMGFSFPLANAIAQHAEASVGRAAGTLYLTNTVGAVCGAIATGFVLLAATGIQGSTTLLACTAALSVVPLGLVASAGAPAKGPTKAYAHAGRRPERVRHRTGGWRRVALPMSLATSGIALGFWLTLPSDHVIARATAPLARDERLLTRREAVTEVIAVTELPGRGRSLMTNGHPMASTAWLDQRYMRALAHIPLLSMERPSRVLVIGFGVGNTAHAATLHPSVERVDVVDLSPHVLEHAGYFRDTNGDVLRNRRVTVYVNDGREHLRMQPREQYDLIVLEPPPIAHAGVVALYSREFYELARTRLKPGGYLGQWFPAYQVPPDTGLAMLRAFIDVFPSSVLLSGMQAELLLLGTTASRIEIDPERVADALQRAPEVQADVQRLALGTVTEIVGTFVGSSETLARATEGSRAVTDDRPLQEYAVHSRVASAPSGVPEAISNLRAVATWCPRCFQGERLVPSVKDLDTYVSLLDMAYRSPQASPVRARNGDPRRLLGSVYLGAIVPDTDSVDVAIGNALFRDGRYDEAIAMFRQALTRADSAETNRQLGAALAESGRTADAVASLRRAVQLDPADAVTHQQLGSVLLERREFSEAAEELESALRVMPNSAAAHNDLGIALASVGRTSQAIEQFQEALRIEPRFAEARRNLEMAGRRGASRGASRD